VAEQAYRVTLWRSRPSWLVTSRTVTREVLDGVQRWIDLASKDAVTLEVATLIDLSGGDPDGIGAYRLDVADVVTGELLAQIRVSYADLEALRNGPAPRLSPGMGLESVSDEALVRELARRLQGR
jgi:hypothetical protein